MFRRLASTLAQHRSKHECIRTFQSTMAISMVLGVSAQTYDALCIATNHHQYILFPDKSPVVTIPLTTFMLTLALPFAVVGVPIGGSMYAIRRLVRKRDHN